MCDVITNNLAVWTSALLGKPSVGRGSNGKQEAYGVNKLRELILKLAIMGRLVPQSDEDEPADPRLVAARSKLRSDGKGARRSAWKESPPVSVEEQKFALPKGWEWARVNDTGFYVNGLAFKPTDWGTSGRPIIRIQNLTDPTKPLNYAQGDFPDEIIVRSGDLLVSWSATLDCFIWDREEAVLNQHIFKVSPCYELVTHRFLYWLLKFSIREMEESDHAHGLVMTHINREPFLAHAVAIPPVAEQERIVAKVDELMVLCDQLEQAQTRSVETHQTLVETLLATLTRAASPQERTEAWSRIATHFDVLFSTEESIDQLKQTILQLAVMGKLTSQDRNDEGVRALLASCDGRRRAVAETDRRADVDPQPVLSGEDRWEVPETWAWRALADLVLFVDYRGKTPAKQSSGVRLLTAKNVRKGLIDLSPEEFVSEEDYTAWMTRGFPKAGDVLFTTEAPLGNAAVVHLNERFALAQRVICLQGYGALDPTFLVLQILSTQFQAILEKNGTGMTAKGIKASKLKQLPIAVPPLAEQRRIVAKVDELMTLSDALKALLAEAQTAQLHLTNAVVEQAVA
jgi:type I restriction enzyme, S subunit